MMEYLMIFVSVTIFTLMLTIGINHSWSELTSLWKERLALLRALIAAIVLVPVVAFVLLKIFNLAPVVATAIALLAAAPGAPLTTKRAKMAGADENHIASLQLMLALVAIVVTPVIIYIFDRAFPLSIGRASPFEVASQVARVTFLPVVVGLLLRGFLPNLVSAIKKPLGILADILFLLLVIALIVLLVVTPALRDQLLIGWPAVAAIVILAAAAVAVGHLLGGPQKERRAGVAIACLARNIGLVIFVAGLSNGVQAILPTVLVYMFLGFGIQILYAVWIKKQR
jgi:BASS family bile acid:Na+ symporter